MKQDPIFDLKVGSSFPTARQLLFRATDAHVEYMRLAKQGKGVDRHLYGLRIIAKMNDIPLPGIFSDPCFARSSHWSMSTSHCGSSALNLFGFGPVVADGFGLGYMIKNDEMDVVITSKYTHRFVSSSVFKAILEASLLEMKSVVECDVRNRLEKGSQVQLFAHPTACADFDYDPTRGFVYKTAARRSLYSRQRGNSTGERPKSQEELTSHHAPKNEIR
jgi:carnitine O-acetyltransferase